MENHDFDPNFSEWYRRVRSILEKSKPLSELVVCEKFLVQNVVSESKLVTIIIDAQPRDDNGRSVNFKGELFDDIYNDLNYVQHYDCGLRFRTIIQVRALNESCPITELIFDGYSPIISGYTINAKLFKGQFAGLYTKSGPRDRFKQRYRTELYLEKDYSPSESALEISILDNDGKILRTDRSITYKDYFKDSIFPKEF